MKFRALILAGIALAACASTAMAEPYRNLFGEYLGADNAALDAKIQAAWDQLFYGTDDTQRVYYPDGGDMAYVVDIANKDVRSEGMSYGMMLAVQLDHKEEFDRLWKWTKVHMYHADGPREGLFAWHCRRDGTQIDAGSASDGEEWFATALFFASGRWGNGSGIFNYEAEANAILHTMLHKGEEGLGEAKVVNMFDPYSKQVRFVPLLLWAKITDPSYHLPMFYELWAEWADADNDFWRDAAKESRKLFHKAANPQTGLMPDYCDFEGVPVEHKGHELFMFDAHRTLAYPAMDWSWFEKDPWQQEQSRRVLGFLSAFRPKIPFGFSLDGTPQTKDTATSLDAMAAVAALAVDRDIGEPFVRDLWEAPIPDGEYRHYNGLIYMFGLLEAGGRFRVYAPEDKTDPVSPERPVEFLNFTYSGDDPWFSLPATDGEYRNPILPGFRPDPSICRVGDDYYLVNSSFAYYPGVPICQSRDLVNWRQIGHVLDRPGQLDLDGAGVSRGIFAPSLSYHDGLFYMVTTLVDKGGNFFVTASDPAGPWSDPVWLPEVDGIDPAFFFDEGGKAWLVNNGPPPDNKSLYDGHRAIWIQEFDVAAQKLVGPRKIIVNGGTKLEDKPVWIEGPHIFKRDGQYYLTCAEGGTSTWHSQVVFRADNPLGPWTPWERNPILTQRDLPKDRPMPVTSTGHAQLVDAGDAGWWAVFLGCRPYEDGLYNTGRETFLLPVTWTEDGWPVILPKGEAVPAVAKAPALPADTEHSDFLPQGNFTWTDDCQNIIKIGKDWQVLRTPRTGWAGVRVSMDEMTRILRPLPVALDSMRQPAFLAYSIQHAHFSAQTALRIPSQQGVDAGLALFQSESWHFFMGIRRDTEAFEVFLEQACGGARTIVVRKPFAADASDSVTLRAEADGKVCTFSYRIGEGEWQVLTVADASILSTARAGGFVGSVVGPHARRQ
ncbi:MAG: glycosyl hydrolase family 8 [Opitutales bacterium]|jgi:alpha-N-arabinofuranosidase